MPKFTGRGFTLIELLVVISIIAILSAVGLVSYQNIRKGAQDAKVKSDLNAIKKAYEANYDPSANGGQGGYKKLQDNQFASGKIPTTDGNPLNSSNTYILPASSPNPDNSLPNFALAVNLNTGASCSSINEPGCYSATSTQGIPVDLRAISIATCDTALSSQLIGYWNFDDDSTSTTVPGTVNGTWVGTGSSHWVPGKIGKAGNFNGSNDYVNILSSNAFNFATNNFTISAWVKSTVGNRSVFGKFSNSKGWGLWVNSTVFINFFGYGALARNEGDKNADPLFDGNWHLVTGVYTFSGNNLTLTSYKDGAVVNPTNTSTSGSLATSGTFQIGAYASSNNFNGQIDDVRIYNRALSAPEVNLLYNSGYGCAS